MNDQEKISHLRVALNDILERAMDRAEFCPDHFKARNVLGLVQIGGEEAAWTMVAILAADALEKTR